MKFVFSGIVLIIIISSCRRDEIVLADPDLYCDTTFTTFFSGDTIHPSLYLMTYPGSWWEYDDEEIVECTQWGNYPTYKWSIDSNGCQVIETTYKYAPLSDNNTLVYGDMNVEIDSSNYQTKFYQIIGELGESWYSFKTFQSLNGEGAGKYKNWYHCDSILESKEVNGVIYSDVIEISLTTEIYYELHLGGPLYGYQFYYAKNVGLIELSQYDVQTGITTVKGLVDYYIAPH